MYRNLVGVLVCGVVFGTAWVAAPPVSALERDRACIDDAVAAKKDCKLRCKTDFLLAKDACWNVDHECADACRAQRSLCYDGPLATLEACLAQAHADLEAAKTACRTQEPPLDPVALDACIDAAQVTAFTRRDECREALDRDAIKRCRMDFRACIGLCPPPAAN